MEDWAAIYATGDRRSRALEIAQARDRVLGGAPKGAGAGKTDPDLRPVIVRSWQRSQAAGVDPDHGVAPVKFGTDEVDRRWEEHPLSIAVPILRGLLDGVGDSEHVALVCDADGSLLWIDGKPAMLDAAREVNLQRGSVWSEGAAGTNAMGTALAERHPVQVFSSEHYAEAVHRWTCSAAPVRDPLSGKVLGVLDLTGALGTAHPHSLAVVTMAANMVERELALKAERTGLTASTTLTVLGRERGLLRIGGRDHVLSRRHTELMLLLWLCEEGLSAEQLAIEIYGERGRPGSIRSELHRLRAQLGPLLGERPYRLTERIACDVGEIERLVSADQIRDALGQYAGPMLARSEVPRIAELRDRVDDQLRAAVLASGEPDLLEAWLRTPTGRDDFEASRMLAVSLPREDPRRAAQRSRIRRLANG
ncbi:MAG: GAF domain-containing protein [Solirubrobacteraceae bacterium]|nr:GAF domain-containing protein [Solirubrobacteraceae bacterium]